MRVDIRSTVCRVCRVYTKSLEDLFTRNTHGYVAAIAIESILQTKVVLGAYCPKYICNDCLQHLTNIRKFRELYLQSEAIFKKGTEIESRPVRIATAGVVENVALKKEFPIDRYDQWGQLLSHEAIDDEDVTDDSGVNTSFGELETEETVENIRSEICRTEQETEQTSEEISFSDDFLLERLKLEDDDEEEEMLRTEVTMSSAAGDGPNRQENVTDISSSAVKDVYQILPHSLPINKPMKTSNSSRASYNKKDKKVSRPRPASKNKESKTKNIKGKEKCFICDHCGHKTSKKYRMEYHMYLHTGRRPFQCNICPKAFTRKYLLKVHIRDHIGDRRYKCDICSKTFLTYSEEKTHKIFHGDVKPFECTTCGKRFFLKGDLKNHESVHTKSRPYKCNRCGNCFRSNRNLKLHLMVHTDVKPYSCEKCGKRYRLAAYLKTHKCLSELLFPCSLCGRVVKGQNNKTIHENACRRRSDHLDLLIGLHAN